MDDLINSAWSEVIAATNDEFDAVIEDDAEFSGLGFSKNIIDTGRLRDSKTVNVQGLKTTWSWNPISPENGYPYAAAVRNGFLAFGKTYIPGRHWDTRAVKRVDPVKKLASELKKQGIKCKIKANRIQDLD